jgi:O-antigen/teichoic acid export membrane protein
MSSKTIARNSVWYGIETGINLVLTLFTSIAMARSVGPARLGYFIFVWWVVNLAGNIGSFGIPGATRKYMSEYFGRGELGVVRSVFYATLKLQTGTALGIAAVAGTVALLSADPAYRMVSFLMALSVLPAMVNAIPSQANNALEDLSANVPSALLSTGIFVGAVFLSISFGWGLLGISVGLLTMRIVELIARLTPLLRKINAYPRQDFPPALKPRMVQFSSQGVALMVLTLVVWDRSELFFLKAFAVDIRQIAFYSVAFNVTERLLVISQMFGMSLGATLMVQYGRDETRMAAIVSSSTRYLALIAFPVHLGLAALAGPVMLLAYGEQYRLAILPLVIASICGIPKAFVSPLTAFLQSHDRQSVLIRWGLISGVVNVALDLLLIPKYGAVGAAIANGSTQGFAAAALWIVTATRYRIDIPAGFLAKCGLGASVMAGTVYLLVRSLPALPALALGVAAGTLIYCCFLRFAKVLDGNDCRRLSQLRNQLPAAARKWFDQALLLLAPAEKPDAITAPI